MTDPLNDPALAASVTDSAADPATAPSDVPAEASSSAAMPAAKPAAPGAAEAVTFTGANADEIRDLDVTVVEHPTQDAVVVFASDTAVDPIGTCAVGQVVQVHRDHDTGETTILIVGAPDRTALVLPEEDRFDPAKSNVDEVLAYLGSLGDDADDQAEHRRVVQLERDGKHRKTILAAGE